MLDSLGTMGAFTLAQKGRPGASAIEADLTATHLTHWILQNSQESCIRMLHATTIANPHPQGLQGPDFPDRRVPFYHSVNLFNMPQTGMFRTEDGTLRIPQWNCTLSGTRLAPEADPTDPDAGPPQIFTPWSENETQLMHRLFPKPDSLCLNFGRTGDTYRDGARATYAVRHLQKHGPPFRQLRQQWHPGYHRPMHRLTPSREGTTPPREGTKKPTPFPTATSAAHGRGYCYGT